MRKHLLFIGLAICAVIIATSPSVQDALLVFLATGEIPGTTIIVPPLTMLGITLVLLGLSLMWGHRTTRDIKLPPLVEKKTQRRAATKKKQSRELIRYWRNTLRPQLQLLQQKLVTLTTAIFGQIVQFFGKLWQICLKTLRSVHLPIGTLRVAQTTRKIPGLVTKKKSA